MSDGLPGYYFRARENGAAVFRVELESRSQRMELVEIAAVNLKNGTLRPQGERALTQADEAAIAAWVAARQAQLEARMLDDIDRAVDHLQQTAHWAQSKASAEEIARVAPALLLAMHDLRQVLIRKRAQALRGSGPEVDETEDQPPRA